MSEYRPTIELLVDPSGPYGWNDAIEACGCCPMPVCPIPIEECEVKTGTATCYDGSEEETFDILHQEWVDGGMVGDEPVWPDGVTYGCFRPWTRPSGADTDDLPTVYRKNTYAITQGGEIWYSGTVGAKHSENNWSTIIGSVPTAYFVDDSYTSHTTYTYDNEPLGGEAPTESAWFADWNHPGGDANLVSCSASTPGSLPSPEVGDLGSWVTLTAPYTECTETVLTNHEERSYKVDFGTVEAPQDCSSKPWGQPQGGSFLDWIWCRSLQKEDPGTSETLGDPLTKLTLVAEAGGNLTEEWTTGSCVASTVIIWPSIGLYDPWEGCDTETVTIIEATVTKLRFRLIVPNDWQTLGGNIPTPGTYFKETWDIVFFPATYDPEDPLSPQPVILAADQTDTWTGPGSGAQDDPSWIFDGGWHEVEPPYEEGEVRRVNRRFECYRNPYGNKPQITGEASEFVPPSLDFSSPYNSMNHPAL